MLIDRVVVNASPLICLFKSGLVDLFPALLRFVVCLQNKLRLITEGVGKKVGESLAPKQQGIPNLMWRRRTLVRKLLNS